MKFIQRLLWPQTCPFCGRVHKEGTCPECEKAVKKLEIKEPRCMQCGKPVSNTEEEYCYDCAHTYHHYDRGCSIWLHKPPVSTSIYRFKYQNQRNYGTYYAVKLAQCCRTSIKAWNPDLIIPIPLHSRKRRQRGYNQAELLAKELAVLTGIKMDSRGLIRKRYTNPQKLLKSSERKENMKEVFETGKDFKPVGSVILVDDIYTTGSTIDAAAVALRRAGVENVCFLTISIGQGY